MRSRTGQPLPAARLGEHLGREIERATKDEQAPAPTQTPAQAAPEPQKPLPVEVRQPDLTPLELVWALEDQSEYMKNRLPLFTAGVVGLSFILLLVAFHSPLISLKAGIMNLLSVSAAYGVMTLVSSSSSRSPLGSGSPFPTSW